MYTLIAINLLTACSTLGLPNYIDGAFVCVCVCVLFCGDHRDS